MNKNIRQSITQCQRGNFLFCLIQGCILVLRTIFLPPPLFPIIFFPQGRTARNALFRAKRGTCVGGRGQGGFPLRFKKKLLVFLSISVTVFNEIFIFFCTECLFPPFFPFSSFSFPFFFFLSLFLFFLFISFFPWLMIIFSPKPSKAHIFQFVPPPPYRGGVDKLKNIHLCFPS